MSQNKLKISKTMVSVCYQYMFFLSCHFGGFVEFTVIKNILNCWTHFAIFTAMILEIEFLLLYTVRIIYCIVLHHDIRLCMTHTTCQHGDIWFCLLSPHIIWKISLSLHPQTAKVILRCASVTLADPHTALPSCLLSVCLRCQAEETYILYSAAGALRSPFFSITCKHICIQTCMDTHSLTHSLKDSR